MKKPFSIWFYLLLVVALSWPFQFWFVLKAETAFDKYLYSSLLMVMVTSVTFIAEGQCNLELLKLLVVMNCSNELIKKRINSKAPACVVPIP